MGIRLVTYVGPYLAVDRDFEWWKFDNILNDGRGEVGVGDQFRILVPAQELEGAARTMFVDPHGQQQFCQISPATIVRETALLSRLAEPLFKYCDDYGIRIHEAWGVVPSWV